MTARDLLHVVTEANRRPGMFFEGGTGTFAEWVALLQGADLVAGDLYGFKEFLVLRLDGADNFTWPALVIAIALPDDVWKIRDETDEAIAVDVLVDLATEFLAEVQCGGRGRILHEYHSWLRRQSWYKPELQTLHSSPPPELMTVEEVSAALGLTRLELFQDLAGLDLRPLRQGSAVVFRAAWVREVLESRHPQG